MNRKECKMAYGDRIYARLSMRGKQIVEFMIEKVSDMTELIGELRAYARKYRGLCKLYVRNMSRGWSIERPLMLYAERYPSAGGWKERCFDEKPAEPVQLTISMPRDL